MSDLPTTGAPRRHLVQFYGQDDQLLARSVARFLAEGYGEGCSLLVVATPEHVEAFVTRLSDDGVDPVAAIRAGRMAVLDAEETLGRFMVDGWPDAALFESVIGGVLEDLRSRSGRPGITAFGEMVALLWQRGDRDAAARVEALWNEFIGRGDLSLFCAYPIDVCSTDFHGAAMHPVLCTHTHVMPGGEAFERSLDQALDEVLGPEAAPTRRRLDSELPASWAVLPRAEGLVLWVREHLPDRADAILARARHRDASSLRAG